MKTQRDPFFDNARFFLILLVVLGHGIGLLSGETLATVYRLIYLFHMPAFVFISGYFSKRVNVQGIINLTIQYFLFQILYRLFYDYVLKKDDDIAFATPIWLLWFQLALIIWKLLTPYLTRLKHPLILSFALAILCGYDNSIATKLCLSRIVVLSPLFLLGYYTSSQQLSKLIQKIHPVFAACVFALSYFLLSYAPNFNIGLLYHSMSYESMNMPQWYAGIFRVIVLAWGILLCLCFFALVPKRQHFYTPLGQRTL